MQNTIALVDDPLFDEHRAPIPHPERPERLGAARQAVQAMARSTELRRMAPRDATDDELLRIHEERYLGILARAAHGTGHFDADTYYGPRSVDAARRAAGGVIAMTEALVRGEARHGLALVRPPGHHARPSGAMGFCLLNNIGLAAAHARSLGVERVAILDFDVHHGNGTQEAFEHDPTVLYLSTHQYPFYPGTGATGEVGRGAGTGFTINVPLPAGSGDATYAASMARIVGPILEQYRPNLMLISAGFDAHHRDPLASMQLTGGGYFNLMSSVLEALPEEKRRVGLVLEGGYDLEGLRGSLTETLKALVSEHSAGKAARPLPAGDLGPDQEQALERARAVHAETWHL